MQALDAVLQKVGELGLALAQCALNVTATFDLVLKGERALLQLGQRQRFQTSICMRRRDARSAHRAMCSANAAEGANFFGAAEQAQGIGAQQRQRTGCPHLVPEPLEFERSFNVPLRNQ